MRFSDSHHLRKTIAGCCMVAGPLCVLAAFVVSPAIHTDAGDQLRSFAAHQDRLALSAVLSLVGIALFVGATMGLMHMLRERMPTYSIVGGGLTLVGLVAIAAQTGALFLAWKMVGDGVQPGDVLAWDGFISAAVSVIATGVSAWLASVGVIILAAGLYRARAVDWWMAAMIAIGAVCVALAGLLGSVAIGIVGGALFLIGLGSTGMMVLRETDADWEHTPEYGGFRPAGHMR
jgi:hypothetical protein